MKSCLNVRFFCFTVYCQDVTQSPEISWSFASKSAEMDCSHNKGITHTQMYWYRQRPGETMTLIVYQLMVGSRTMVESLKLNIQPAKKKIKTKNGSLTVELAEHKHSAVYYCAARTKLTVLDRPVTPPKVKILQPSQQECRNQKEKQRKKTLVCVASGFYPDHVTVSWKINDEDYSSGVATDSAAQEIEGSYRITSRFKVNAALWENQENSFMCIVSFFDGETTTNHTATLHGVQGEYLKVTQSAKLSYVVVIVKSSCFCTVYPAYTHVVFYCLSMLYLFLCKSFTANFYPDKRYLPVSVYFGSLKA
uniref:Ig-like domain-containing protein n=1 Tax=Amphiprion ocellaris TaxID=80972 RepID=A0A3Q1C9B0_AMPOC